MDVILNSLTWDTSKLAFIIAPPHFTLQSTLSSAKICYFNNVHIILRRIPNSHSYNHKDHLPGSKILKKLQLHQYHKTHNSSNNIKKTTLLLIGISKKISSDKYILQFSFCIFAGTLRSFMLSQNLRNYQAEKKPYYE